MTRHPWKRLAAWSIDCAVILGYAGLLAAVGIPLYLAGFLRSASLLLENAVSAFLLVIPAVLVLAGLEASQQTGTIGKRILKLRVTGLGDTRIAYLRAVVRNTMKFGIPWLIAHATVYAIWSASSHGSAPGWWIWALLAVSYGIPIVWVVSLFIGTGRTPYDRLAHTQVAARGTAHPHDAA